MGELPQGCEGTCVIHCVPRSLVKPLTKAPLFDTVEATLQRLARSDLLAKHMSGKPLREATPRSHSAKPLSSCAATVL